MEISTHPKEASPRASLNPYPKGDTLDNLYRAPRSDNKI